MQTQDNYSQSQSQNIEDAAKIIQQADNICILTGAGISAESGIPTFRDKQTGLWENYSAEDLANIEAFKRNPEMVWSWYQWRRGMVQDKTPNPAHHALVKWQHWAQSAKTQQAEGQTPATQKITLITQNVDDLHEQAGSHATHLHGYLWRNKCSQCDAPYTQEIDYTQSGEALLQCEHCGGHIRPDIVWFGEMLPQKEWLNAQIASENCDVFISIGTSSLVYPAAGLAQNAKQHGAKIIEINLHPTQTPFIDIVLAGKAGDVVPKLVEQIIA